MYGYIYKTTNLLNGKMYIGKHHSSVFEPEKYIGSGPILVKALKKYGKENFKCELIEWCDSKTQLDLREQHWIKILNCQKDPRYYNLAKGGDGGVGRNGSDPTNYWSDPIKRQAAIAKTKVSLKKYYEEHPEAHAGKNNPNWGVKATEQTRKKISEKLKNSPGVQQSSRFTGKKHTQETKDRLSSWGAQKRWINNGIVATYIQEGESLPDGFVFGKLPSTETLARNQEFQTLQLDNKTGKKKKVICIELNQIFESAAQAERKLGVNKTKISSCCHGRANSAGGYHWRFVEEAVHNGKQ
jgi:group I intron endonuclease